MNFFICQLNIWTELIPILLNCKYFSVYWMVMSPSFFWHDSGDTGGYGIWILIKVIGGRIREIRAQKGMTQEQLAGKIGIDPKYLSSIERGRENPTLNTLLGLSKALEPGRVVPSGIRREKGPEKRIRRTHPGERRFCQRHSQRS